MDGALAQIETKQLRRACGRWRPTARGLDARRSPKPSAASGVDVDTLEILPGSPEARHARRRPTLIGARVDQSCRAEWYELLRG